MSDSIDNTAELDSYGVWVKGPGASSESQIDEEKVITADESFDFEMDTETTLNLPDFPETEDNTSQSEDTFSIDDIFNSDENDKTEQSSEISVEEPVSDEIDLGEFNFDENTSESDDANVSSAEDSMDISFGDVTSSDEEAESDSFDFESITSESSSDESVSDGAMEINLDDFTSSSEDSVTEETFTDTENPISPEETISDEPVFENFTEETSLDENTDSDDFEISETLPDDIKIDEIQDDSFETSSIDIAGSDFSAETPSDEISTDEISTDEISTDEISTDDFATDEFTADTSENEILPDDFTGETVSESDSSETVTEEFNFDEISMDSITGESTSESESSQSGETTFEETSIDDFLSDSTTSTDENTSVEKTSDTSDTSDTFVLPEEDGEISIDDFLDGGFSDESVAAGNNGYEPGKEPGHSDDGEISLDDFMDGASFSNEPKEEEIIDEKPLEMDISFDNSVDSIETEDNIQTDTPIYEDDFTPTETTSFETEDVSSEFGDFTSSSGSGKTEDIDLSDFGIDANAEETPINQDVEAQKEREEVIDFDLSVSDENLSSAPVVNEVIDSDEKNSIEASAVQAVPVAAAVAAPDPVTTDLLKQIVADLSGLKNEINALKSNLAEIKAKEALETENKVFSNETEEESDFISENVQEVQTESEPVEDTGFFGSDDGDDTIALSGNELDNIMNTVEITEESSSENTEDETFIVENEEPVIEETYVNEPEIEDTGSEEDTGFFSSTEGEDAITLSGNELDNIMNSVEITEESTAESDNDSVVSDSIFGDVDDSIDFDSDEETEIPSDDESSVSEENLEEPSLDDIDITASMETENEDLPSEISIPKEDDMMVASSDDDFMSSVSTDAQNEKVDDYDEFMSAHTTVPEPLTDGHIDYLSNDENVVNDEIFIDETADEENSVDSESYTEENSPVFEETPELSLPDVKDFIGDAEPSEKEVSNNNTSSASEEIFMVEASFPTVENCTDPVYDDEDSKEDSFSETEEPVIVETSSEPVFEETSVDITEEPAVEETAVKENIQEPTSETSNGTGSDGSINSDLKKDIKSVLLYMDQLLENLPEEKIIEFAKSDEFSTYKKLFSELGLA